MLLQRDKEGRRNWILKAGARKQPATPVVHRLTVNKGRLGGEGPLTNTDPRSYVQYEY